MAKPRNVDNRPGEDAEFVLEIVEGNRITTRKALFSQL